MVEEHIYTEANRSPIFGPVERFFHDLFRKYPNETRANLSTFEWFIFLGTLIYVLVMPFLYSRLTTENFLTPKEFFSKIFLGLLGGLFCVRLFGNGLLGKKVGLSKTTLDLPLLALFGFCALSVIWNYNGISAIRDLREVFVIMLLFPIIVNVFRSRWQVELLLWVVVFTGIATATIGLMETYNWYFKFDSTYPWIHYVKDQVLAKNYDVNGYYLPLFPQLASPDYAMGSVVSTFGNRNYLGTFAMFVAFVPLAFYFYYKNIFMKAISLGLFGWLLYGLYITRCRAALIGFAVGFIFMIIMVLINDKKLKLTSRYGIFFGLVVAFLIIGLTVSALTIRSETMWSKLKLTASLNRLESNTYERMWVWYGNNKAFTENLRTLLIGQGFGSFKHFFPLKEAEVFSDKNKESFTAVTFRQAHNDWLQIFSELGIVGMVLFLFLVSRFFSSIQNSLKRDIFFKKESEMNGDHILIISLGAAMVAQLFAGLPDFPFHRIETAVFAVIFLSLVPVLTETNFFKSSLQRIPFTGLKKPLCIFLVIFAFAGSILNYVHEMCCWEADTKVREAELIMTSRNSDFSTYMLYMLKARKMLLDAIKLDPLPGDPYNKLATWYEVAGNDQFRNGLKAIAQQVGARNDMLPTFMQLGLITSRNTNALSVFANECALLAEDLDPANSSRIALAYADKAWRNINFNARSTYHSITYRKMHIYYHVLANIVMAYSEAIRGLNRTAGDARLIYYYYAGKIAADLLRYPQYLKGLDIKELEANAEKHLKRLLKAEQFKLQANASLALFYAQKSDWKNAFVYATAASKDVPDDPTMLNIIGLAAYNTGNNDIAIQTLEKVITIAPNNPVYHRDLGMAYKKAKNYSLAKNHFEKCIASKNCPEELRTYAFRELESLKNLQETNNGY